MTSSILSLLELSPEQQAAALSACGAVAVTAGAGSGKTRTLAGRYLWFVEQGYPIRSLIAITFTEKAAREMRNRIRKFIGDWRNQVADKKQRQHWDQAILELDAARIGTIHSLCADILRSNPAEAGIDPGFEVLEENMAILLQARAVQQALAWAIEDSRCARLFGPLNEDNLRNTLVTLLQKRLDAEPAFHRFLDDPLALWSEAVASWFDTHSSQLEWQQAIADLSTVEALKAEDKMEMARVAVLDCWATIVAARSSEDWAQVMAGLAELRKSTSSFGSKTNWQGNDLATARAAMTVIRTYYDENLKPIFGKAPPAWALDVQVAGLLPDLRRLFEYCLALYKSQKEERHALDFDDLESKALSLLADHPSVRERWQTEIAAVLVDEFQDTNSRQRQLIDHLTGFSSYQTRSQLPTVEHSYSEEDADANKPADEAPLNTNFFIVGDAKQSIYRFRGADVTVLIQTQAEIAEAGGQLTDLDTTYRAHKPLVETLNALLAPILGEKDEAVPDYYTPFAPLKAYRLTPKLHAPPFLEFHLGLGNAEEGRAAASTGLAQRLQELHTQGSAWGDMALLFRASSAFAYYEDALEAAGIPFVTVAGRGFYDRPEVRDLLTCLAAIDDPSDDLMMAGLLRSPAFGLSDAALFLLRWGHQSERRAMGFQQALADETMLASLDPADQKQAQWASNIVTDLHNMVGRRSVAEVLKALLDKTHYQSALRWVAQGERAWRNVEKLVADTHRSGLIGIPDFLEYVQNLRDVAAREGEAPSEAGNAVQLMTVHKAKGLEFPIIIIGDAGYDYGGGATPLLLDDHLGPILNITDPDLPDSRPLIYQLAALRQRDMESAESRRLLYVAATRAEEKLLISGYCNVSTSQKQAGRLMTKGWLDWLGDAVGLVDYRLDEMPAETLHETLPWHQGEEADLWLYPYSDSVQPAISHRQPPEQPVVLDQDIMKLVNPLPRFAPAVQTEKKLADREADPPPRVWRVATRDSQSRTPHWVVGTLVHRALQRWRFPDRSDFNSFLKPFALDCGLVREHEIKAAVRDASRLLATFQDHALFQVLDQAERHHEVPYNVLKNGEVRSGYIDLLVRTCPEENWRLYDFKTDQLNNRTDLQAYIHDKKYDEQVRQYIAAVEQVLKVTPDATLVFLNVGGQIRIERISS